MGDKVLFFIFTLLLFHLCTQLCLFLEGEGVSLLLTSHVT